MNVCSWPTGTSLSLWWKWRDISGFSFQGSFSISSKGYVHVHVLFDWAWSGLTGKYLARGPDVRTKRYAVDLHGWKKNIFLSDQTQSIGILSCDRFEIFCVNLIKTRWTGARGTTTKKILQKMTFPLFFSSQNKKITIHQKTFFFLLFSFFLGVFTKKPCSYRAGQLFLDRLSSTRAALRMSAFSMVFHGTTRTVPHGSFDKCAGWWHNHLFLSPKKTSVDHLDVISLQYEERMRIQKAGGTVR